MDMRDEQRTIMMYRILKCGRENYYGQARPRTTETFFGDGEDLHQLNIGLMQVESARDGRKCLNMKSQD